MKRKRTAILFLVAFCTIVFIVLMRPSETKARFYMQVTDTPIDVSPTPILTPTPISTPTSSPNITPASLQVTAVTSAPDLSQPVFVIPYEQWKDIQKDVLETTRKTVETALSVITILLAIITLFVTVLTAVGGLAGITVYRRISDAAKRAEKVLITVENIEAKASDFGVAISGNQTELDGLKREYRGLNDQLETTKNEFNEINNWRKSIKHDLQYYKDTLTLVNLEERSVELFGDDEREVQNAIRALIQMTEPEYKAFIRRRCVNMLSQYVLKEPNPTVISCLRKAASEDASSAVRKTAEEALQRLDR